jgi:RNA polymerase sigma-54 factor
MLKQGLQQKLLQKLSPQQILLMKLLQIPSMALEQRIKQEIEENPALEVEENAELDEAPEEEFESDTEVDDDYDGDENYDSTDDEFGFEDYIEDDDIPNYKLNTNNSSADDTHYEAPSSSEPSFQELLIQQLGYRVLDERKNKIALYIIGNLDDSGYLTRPLDAMTDDLLFNTNLKTTKKELQEVLFIIQEFDPPGVGARNLQECLLIQLKRKHKENVESNFKLPILIIERFFNEFTKKHYDKIIKRANITEAELKEALNEILNLNPKPGSTSDDSTTGSHYVIPDFIIYNHNGELELSLSSRNAPELRISRHFMEMIQIYSETKTHKGNKEAFTFAKAKIDSAKWFIDAIQQRQNTLIITMNAIMNYQKKYFLSGDETTLRPMILKDIAEVVNLDISTISRVANSKYVQTPFGTFLLKSFFSESMQNEEGEEISTREIKKILSDCIEAEEKGKPLTDEQLMVILKEKGYNIARRTVAKYREQLNISVARLRKEL